MTKKADMLNQYLTNAERAAALSQIKAAVKSKLGEAIDRIAIKAANAEAKRLRPEIEKEVHKQIKIRVHNRIKELAKELLQDLRLVLDD